jgi:aminoglycoside/choline kinase family phosphotransferase|tara:strand:- start:599 stop:1525 length:927 start_codon:yes stop_codon:yes gene_type:complete
LRADQKEITNWLSKTIGNSSFNIKELRQEASDRKYYRIKAENISYVLTDNFDKTDQSANFLYASKILKNSSVNVPEVLAFSEDLRFVLLQDLGDESLDINDEYNDEKILEMALEQLSKIYFSDQDVLKSVTKESLLLQTNSFMDFCREKKCSNDEIKSLENLRNELVHNLLNQQFIPSHNDFERRNLMMFEGKLFVIDFQDLNMGPIGIDLASIMYEHSYEYPKALIDNLLEKHLKNNGLNASSAELKDMIMHALAHRSMRVVGTFNKYFKEGKLLNRKLDLEKFLKRIYLALSTLKKEEAKIVKKLL